MFYFIVLHNQHMLGRKLALPSQTLKVRGPFSSGSKRIFEVTGTSYYPKKHRVRQRFESKAQAFDFATFLPTSFNGKVLKCRSVMLRNPLLLLAPKPNGALQGFPLTFPPLSRTKRLNLLERHLIATAPKRRAKKSQFPPPHTPPYP